GPEAITVELDAGGVTVTSPERRAGPPVDVLRRVAAWFDLDTDLDAVDRRLAGDPALAAIAAARPGQRIVGYPDGFEATVVTVLGQQVSVRGACTFAGRLAASFGRPGPAGTLAFPSAEDLARVPPDDLRRALGITASRSRTLRAVAELFADGFRIDPASARVAAERARSTLAAVPGLGPWSVEYLAMRALHDPDACPAGDLVLRRALRVERAADVLDRAQAWRPFRAYAVIRLWTASVTGMAELGG
ncbi:MAG TPA: AlkA N-terminal domain-containing protein, partial [Microlunatus sp.]|nr:AlkA N-terminal domain-containing protein [Microlunatus sp.]